MTLVEPVQEQPSYGIWRCVATPAILGVAAGALTSYEALFTSYHPLWGLARRLEFSGIGLWTATLLAMFALALWLFQRRRRIFGYRYSITVGLAASAGVLSGVNLGRLDIFEFLFILIVPLWLASVLVERRPVRTPGPVLVLLLVLTAATVASFAHGGLVSILSAHALLTKLVVFFVLTNLVTDEKILFAALKTIVVVAAASAVIAILAQALYLFAGYEFTFADEEIHRYRPTSFGLMLRSTAFASTPHVFGHYMIMAFAIAMFLPMRILARVALCALLFVGVVSTFSKGAVLTCAGLLLLAPFVRKPAQLFFWLAMYAAVALAVYTTGLGEWAYTNVVNPGGAGSLTDRIELARQGLEAMDRHPVLGSGINNFERVMKLPIHNAYLQATFEIGVIGAAAFLSLVLYLGIRGLVTLDRVGDVSTRTWLKGLLLGYLGICVNLLAAPLYYDISTWVNMSLVASAIAIYSVKRTIPVFLK